MIIKEIDGVVHVIDSCFYAIGIKSQVTLTVTIGDFQAGGTSSSWKGKTVTGNPNFENHPINSVSTPIVDSALHCMSKVIDIRPETNQTSVTFTLKGGKEERSYPFGIQVAKEHGMAVYQITFVFTESGS